MSLIMRSQLFFFFLLMRSQHLAMLSDYYNWATSIDYKHQMGLSIILKSELIKMFCNPLHAFLLKPAKLNYLNFSMEGRVVSISIQRTASNRASPIHSCNIHTKDCNQQSESNSFILILLSIQLLPIGHFKNLFIWRYFSQNSLYQNS